MEGRTKINYGYNSGLITMKDINYMFNIINSDLSEEAKAIKLYSFCNLHSLISNRDIYNTLELEQVEKLKELIRVYRDYEAKGLFKSAKNPYKCTLEEIALRLKKINSVFEIMNSDDKDYIKVEQLLSLFKSAERFRKSYALFNKYGKKDERLSSARIALDNFNSLYTKFKEYEAKGIIDNVRYVLSIQDYLQNYEYAKFAIGHYIESPESYKESEFLSELGLDIDTFNFCISTIEELDVDLYKLFLEKKEINNKIRCVKNSETITNLANGINTGILSDGTQFDLLEFIKRVPFKKSNNFTFTLIDFMKRNNPDDMDTIIKYVYSNGLNKPSTFAPLDLKGIYTTKTIINGIEITNADNDIILDYLKVNNIPLIHKAYVFARTKYLNGEITAELVQEQKAQLELNKEPAKILIPNNK